MREIAGGCLCGAVRYKSEAEPVLQALCHCQTCRKNSGSAFSFNVAVPEDSLVVEGDGLQTYEDHSGASTQAFMRNFCGKCGSHIFSLGPAYGPLAFIKAGTLGDASWVAPELHIWCAEKLPWTMIPEGATQAPGNPG
ncbi:MAG: GFA family protein [Hyphomicrobiaceae bacterium]